MAMRFSGGILAGCLALAGPVAAETLAEAYGLGAAAPRPEQAVRMPGGLILTASLRDDAGGLAATVMRPEVIRLDLALSLPEGAAEVRLRCKARFLDAENPPGPVRSDSICFEGRVQGGTAPVPSDLAFRFRPSASDPAGTLGVELIVMDEITGDGRSLVVTYDWRGGRP